MAGTVSIVATGRRGQRAGLTVTSVTSLSMDPPALLVCLNRGSSTFGAVVGQRRFSVNLLAQDHILHAQTFSSGATSGEQRFVQGSWCESDYGVPCLTGATATVFCEMESCVPYGSHVAVIGRVLGVQLGGKAHEPPLLYFSGEYSALLPGRS